MLNFLYYKYSSDFRKKKIKNLVNILKHNKIKSKKKEYILSRCPNQHFFLIIIFILCIYFKVNKLFNFKTNIQSVLHLKQVYIKCITNSCTSFNNSSIKKGLGKKKENIKFTPKNIKNLVVSKLKLFADFQEKQCKFWF